MAKQIRGNRNTRNNISKLHAFKNRKRSTGTLKSDALIKSKNRIIKKTGATKAAVVQDARQKIVQKKRKSVLDARDILVKIAKTQDARMKLDKIRTTKNNRSSATVTNVKSPQRQNIKVIGSNILQKTDKNGKISLVTNKTSISRKTTNTTNNNNSSHIKYAIKQQLGLINRPKIQHQLKKISPKKSQQTIRTSTPEIRKLLRKELSNFDSSVLNDSSSLYRWGKPSIHSTTSASNLINSLEPARQAMRDVMREELLLAKSNWPNVVTPKPSISYIDLDDEPSIIQSLPNRIALQGSNKFTNVHSRLDSVGRNEAISHGILSQPKTKVVVPVGHRIVVSNLQGSVTEDDIKELFEDIGQLLSAKLIKPGVAEVIYRSYKDAQKAVDTYHNRQLDGQPMKCILVNGRSFGTSSTAGVSARYVSERFNKIQSDKLVPDVSTIHKVLFQRK